MFPSWLVPLSDRQWVLPQDLLFLRQCNPRRLCMKCRIVNNMAHNNVNACPNMPLRSLHTFTLLNDFLKESSPARNPSILPLVSQCTIKNHCIRYLLSNPPLARNSPPQIQHIDSAASRLITLNPVATVQARTATVPSE